MNKPNQLIHVVIERTKKRKKLQKKRPYNLREKKEKKGCIQVFD